MSLRVKIFKAAGIFVALSLVTPLNFALAQDEPVLNVVPTPQDAPRDGFRDLAQSLTISSEEIAMTGATNIEEALSRLSSISLRGIKSNHPLGKGIVSVDLRNLEPGRLLVLINGRRTVGAGGPIVDLSTIPVSMVQRVEVSLGGASAVFGADAVAGVINLILRDDFDGFEVGTGGGISTYLDGEKISAHTTMGVKGDKGSAIVSFNWNHRSPVYQRDRKWANPPCDTVYFNEFGEVEAICGSQNTPGGSGHFFGLNPQAQVDAPSGWIFDENGDYHALYPLYEGQVNYDAYNYGEQMTLSGQSDRFQIFTNGKYKLGNHATAYMEGHFAFQKHGGRYAGEPSGYGTDLYPGRLMVHLSSPFIPDAFYEEVVNYYGIDLTSPFLQMQKRTNDLGARIFDTTTNTFRTVAGIRGEISTNHNYDIYFSYGSYTAIDGLLNSVDVQRFHTALDPEACYATPGCILANIFGTGTMTGDVRDSIGFDKIETRNWDSTLAAIRYSMSPFDLPGGKFRAVIGGDARLERGRVAQDSKIQDGVSNQYAYQPTMGSYNAQEAFIDMSVPFFGNMPFTYLLNLDVAARASHFSSFGNVFSYRGQLSWAPWRDILFRGVYATSFRAPNIDELYGGEYVRYLDFNDPCQEWINQPNEYLQQQCQADGLEDLHVQHNRKVATSYGGNPELKPELSRTFGLGLVLAPSFLPENLPISLTFDYYSMWVSQVIRRVYGQTVMDNCYTNPDLSDYCDYVERGDGGDISRVDALLRNQIEIYTSGYDFTFNLGFPIWRTFVANVGLQMNILKEYVERNPEIDYSPEEVEPDNITGVIFARAGGLPKQRYVASVTVGDSVFKLNNRLRYIQGMNIYKTEVDANPFYNVGSVYYWDVSAMVELDGINVTAGVQNVLGQEPPFLPGSNYNTNSQVYDLIGRYIFMSVSYSYN